jgi:hypothetical protein
MILDYPNGIHPDCGVKFYVENDIIITPFWTEQFCNNLVQISNQFSDKFSKDIDWSRNSSYSIGWDDLALDKISPILFQEFVAQYKQYIIPLIGRVFTYASADIHGWFVPHILRYNQIGQHADLHNDTSSITLNIKLNNDYEGCDLKFPRQQFSSANIPIGYAMIWPSTVTHPHYSEPLISGTKLSLTAWTWPPAWRESGVSKA